MRVLLIEPYFTGSHRAWAEGYQRFSQHDVDLITLAGQFWRWRLTGGHLPLARLIVDHAETHGAPDVMLATSMTNLPALLAHTRKQLAAVPTALYMHENQLTYIDRTKPADYGYAAINWASMTAADQVIFNSEFHRTSWFDAARTWLGSFPDHVPNAEMDRVAAESVVVPVGIDLARLEGAADRSDPPLILWNHRADTDKAPQRFVEAMLELAKTGADFRVAVCGERFVDSGDVFDPLLELGDRLVHNGFADDDTYGDLLRAADIVVSTAAQEFYGIAVTEAIYCGAFPVLPDRLVYPERLPSDVHERCLYQGRRLVDHLQWALANPEERRTIAGSLHEHMAVSDWSVVAPELDAVLTQVAGLR